MEVLDIKNKFPQSLGTSLNRGSIVYYFRTLLLGFTVRNANFSRLHLSHNSQRRLERQENQTKYKKKMTRAQFNKTFTSVIYKCSYCFRVRETNSCTRKLHL